MLTYLKFRWVSCQLDALKKCLKVSTVKKVLSGLPKTLDDTYARILTNIDEDYHQVTLRSLMWFAFSERPLRIEELAEAIVLNSQSDPCFDQEERFPDPHNILRILGSLVTIASSPDTGEEIRLGHISVKSTSSPLESASVPPQNSASRISRRTTS
jgi:hypothetical protein